MFHDCKGAKRTHEFRQQAPVVNHQRGVVRFLVTSSRLSVLGPASAATSAGPSPRTRRGGNHPQRSPRLRDFAPVRIQPKKQEGWRPPTNFGGGFHGHIQKKWRHGSTGPTRKCVRVSQAEATRHRLSCPRSCHHGNVADLFCQGMACKTHLSLA